MKIWVEGKEYEMKSMPNDILARCLRTRIRVDYENMWLPDLNKKEGYAILEEAAKRLASFSFGKTC